MINCFSFILLLSNFLINFFLTLVISYDLFFKNNFELGIWFNICDHVFITWSFSFLVSANDPKTTFLLLLFLTNGTLKSEFEIDKEEEENEIV